MPNRYKALRDKQQHEVNEFPFFFAFNEDQFAKGMKSLGLSPGEEGKLYRLGSTGGFYRRTDSGKLKEMFSRMPIEHFVEPGRIGASVEAASPAKTIKLAFFAGG